MSTDTVLIFTYMTFRSKCLNTENYFQEHLLNLINISLTFPGFPFFQTWLGTLERAG